MFFSVEKPSSIYLFENEILQLAEGKLPPYILRQASMPGSRLVVLNRRAHFISFPFLCGLYPSGL